MCVYIGIGWSVRILADLGYLHIMQPTQTRVFSSVCYLARRQPAKRHGDRVATGTQHKCIRTPFILLNVYDFSTCLSLSLSLSLTLSLSLFPLWLTFKYTYVCVHAFALKIFQRKLMDDFERRGNENSIDVLKREFYLAVYCAINVLMGIQRACYDFIEK